MILLGKDNMADISSNAMEGLKLISDWAKWLITVETAAIAVIGAYLKGSTTILPGVVKILSTMAVCSFVISIAAAALLLLSLPEIAQQLDGTGNIWLTHDSVIGRVFGANTQTFATIESFFFGLGVVLIAALVVLAIWFPAFRSS
jgi:hypothetical protein